jgi:hypothetical protein
MTWPGAAFRNVSICVIFMLFFTEILTSDKIEELQIFSDIMKLVPSFKDVVMACSGHQRALVNLIRMVSFNIS